MAPSHRQGVRQNKRRKGESQSFATVPLFLASYNMNCSAATGLTHSATFKPNKHSLLHVVFVRRFGQQSKSTNNTIFFFLPCYKLDFYLLCFLTMSWGKLDLKFPTQLKMTLNFRFSTLSTLITLVNDITVCSTENLTQQKFMYARQVLRQLSYTSSIIQLSLICAFPSRLHQLWSLSSVIWVEANIINLKHY